MVHVGRRPSAPPAARTPDTREAGEARAPQCGANAPEAPLPRSHRVETATPPCDNAHGLIARLGAFFRRHEKPVAAVMAGASALPILCGAGVAHAAPLQTQQDAPPAQAPDAAASTDVAREVLFGAPSATPPRPAKIDRGTAALLALREALIKKAFEANPGLTGPGPRPIDMTPVPEVDKDVASSAIRAIDQMITQDAKLPSGLVADLEKLRTAVADAPTGELTKAIDSALGAARDGSKLAGPGKSFIDGIKSGAPDGKKIIDAYAKGVSGIDKALPSLPNTKLTLPFPATFSNGGATIRVPAGTTISTKSGMWRLDSPGLSYTDPSTSVTAGKSTIILGGGPDSLSLQTLKVASGSTAADLTGVGASIDRASRTGTISADKAILDLSTGHFELEGAKLGVGPDGTTTLDASRLAWDTAKGSGSASTVAASFGDKSSRLEATGITATAKDGTKITAGSGAIQIDTRADGSTVLDLRAKDAKLELPKGGTIETKGTAIVDIEQDKDGKLQAIHAKAADLRYTGSFGALTLEQGGTLDLRYGPDGKLAGMNADVASMTLAKGAGKLSIEGGKASGTFGADGSLEKLELGGEKVVFTSDKNGHNTGVTLNGANLVVTQIAGGGQKLALTGKDAQLDLDGHKVDIQGAKGVEITTDAAGKLKTLDASFPGPITFEQKGGDLKVVVTGLDLHTRDAGRTLSARFDEAAIRLESKDLTATVRGATATLTPDQVRIHVDSAELTKNLGDPLSAKIEGVDLIVDKNAKGGIGTLDLKLAGFEGKVKGYDVFATTAGGDRLRLHVEADESGNLIKTAYLQIPKGGEIKIEKKNLSVVLGPQTFTLERDASGAYTIGARDLNVDVTTKKAEVHVDGGTAKVKLDPATGRLVIEEVHGTRVDVKAKGITATIDIQKLDGFLFRMTGVKGAAAGASIHLTPTSDASRLDITVHAKVKGIPVVVELDGVHQLDASASAGDNQAHVYLGDPSGRGKVKVGLGPLEMKGSAIEIFARYQQYDSGRMMSLVDRYLSTDGIELVRGLTIEPDGVVRLGTRGDGVKADVAVLLPRGTGSTPLYVIDPGDGAKDGATGVVVSLGGQWTNGKGTSHSLSAFGGLLPGSYVDWRMTQGHASVLGVVTLPDQMKIPSTGVAGLTYERKASDGARLGVSAGGYVNPAGLAKLPGILDEPKPFGVFGGVHVRTNNVSLGLDGLVDLDTHGKPTGGGGRLTLGVSF